MTRAHLHGVTILADATMAMVTFSTGRPRRFPMRTSEEYRRAIDEVKYRFGTDGQFNEAGLELVMALGEAWLSHIEEAWAALEARTKPEGGE